MIFENATGVCGGVLVFIFEKLPPDTSFARLGMRPASINFFVITGSRPSNATTRTRWPELDEPGSLRLHEVAIVKPAAPATVVRKSRRRIISTAQRGALHVGRFIDTQQIKRCRGQVDYLCGVVIEFQIRKKHSRHQVRMNAMITAPGFFVV